MRVCVCVCFIYFIRHCHLGIWLQYHLAGCRVHLSPWQHKPTPFIAPTPCLQWPPLQRVVMSHRLATSIVPFCRTVQSLHDATQWLQWPESGPQGSVLFTFLCSLHVRIQSGCCDCVSCSEWKLALDFLSACQCHSAQLLYPISRYVGLLLLVLFSLFILFFSSGISKFHFVSRWVQGVKWFLINDIRTVMDVMSLVVATVSTFASSSFL